MPTEKQTLGKFGELLVIRHCFCPKCKRVKTLKQLPNNFKCSDIICDFCGYLAQVKATNVSNVEKIPFCVLGGAWRPQQERMQAGIYIPLFVVLVKGKDFSIFYLSADAQTPDLFVPRNPLSSSARRAGWQGFMYDFRKLPSGTIIKLK